MAKAKKKAPKAPARAHEVLSLLDVRHQYPEWVGEREITLDRRRIDYLAINLWRRNIIAYEVKVTRTDWLNELANHTKNGYWSQIADQFYIVSANQCVKADELPVGWGLLEMRGTRLFTKIVAQEPADKPKTYPREIAIRLYKRLMDRAEKREREAVKTATDASSALWKDHMERELAMRSGGLTDDERRRHELNAQTVQRLSEAFGTSMYGAWAHDNLVRAAKAYRKLQDIGVHNALREVKRIQGAVDVHATLLVAALEQINTLQATEPPHTNEGTHGDDSR